MRIIEGLKLRPLGKQYLVMVEGQKQVDFNRMISMNVTAAFLFQEVQGIDFDCDTLAQLLVNECDITKEQAAHDAALTIEEWQKAGIIQG